MLTVEEFRDKFGSYISSEKNEYGPFNWDKFNEAIKLNYEDIIKLQEGWITPSKYLEEYGPEGNKTGILLIETLDTPLSDKGWHLDIILKDNEGNRVFYTAVFSVFIGGIGFHLRKENGWTAWRRPLLDNEYFTDINRVMDITHLLPEFSLTLKAFFLNWYEDNPLEVK